MKKIIILLSIILVGFVAYPQSSTTINKSVPVETKMINCDSVLSLCTMQLNEKDSILQAQEKQLSILKNEIPEKPEAGSLWYEYVIWIIGCGLFFILGIMSLIPQLQNVPIPFIQRIASEMSSFMKKTQIWCGTAAILCMIFGGTEIFGTGTKMIFLALFGFFSTIANFTWITTKKVDLLK